MIVQNKPMKFKGVTKKTKDLLHTGEDYNVDYKLKSTQVDPDDFVSFANSKNGGTILFGVEEMSVGGLQKGEIVGCEVGDKQKQTILNKALSCSPSIEISVFIENYKSKPIFRVEIPSGKKKPYSTNSGKYLIRENGRNRALHPVDLLKIYLENETGEFLRRFNSVTEKINSRLEILNKDVLEKIMETTQLIVNNTEKKLQNVITELEQMTSDIDYMSEDINQSLKEIFESASSAESFADETMAFSDETNSLTQNISQRVEDIGNDMMVMESRIKLLLKHFNIEDPLISRQKAILKLMIKRSLESNPKQRFATIKKSLIGNNIFLNVQFIDEFGKECYNLVKKEVSGIKN